tara:strand:- start:1796 stop:2221 length:426 start_codon:yes stop_codon:yes gene_type:complete
LKKINEIQTEIVEEFSFFEDWLQRYEYLIELGKSLPKINSKFMTDDYLINGCQSQVWLHAEFKKDKVIFTAGSDAIISKGIIAILIRAFSNQTPIEIINAKTEFIDQIGLRENLSPSRSNGMFSMIKQIKMYALIFKTQLT